MANDPYEFPGLALADGPVFASASDDRVVLHDERSLLDLAMGFGAYIHGYVQPPARSAQRPAPGLGDLYSHELRYQANHAICQLVADNWRHGDTRPELCSMILHSGSEAVETAIKTALVATGRSSIISFTGAYHGTFGLALAATHRSEFRAPFASAYSPTFVQFCEWGAVPTIGENVACVIVEPWQGRAGVIPPPDGFLAGLREACTMAGSLLVVDSVLMGSGRAGVPMLGAELAPDILCLGKALGAGTAVSATVCTTDVADRAWGAIAGEAIHTSTFVADPAACAALISACEKSRATEWSSYDQRWRGVLAELAHERRYQLRGQGLVWALDTGVENAGFTWSQQLLDAGVVVIPSGPAGESITLLPSTQTDPNEAVALLGSC